MCVVLDLMTFTTLSKAASLVSDSPRHLAAATCTEQGDMNVVLQSS